MCSRNDRFTLRSLRTATSLFVLLISSPLVSPAADSAGNGSIIGSVTSKGTHNALQGAFVSIPALNRTVFSDSSGQFVLQGVPTGVVELVVSYSGFAEVS